MVIPLMLQKNKKYIVVKFHQFFSVLHMVKIFKEIISNVSHMSCLLFLRFRKYIVYVSLGVCVYHQLYL